MGPKDEADKRFNYFTNQVRFRLGLTYINDCSLILHLCHQLLPQVLKSAVQSTNTLVFVPSSFDFIRVQNHFRKNVGVPFAVLSECVLFLAAGKVS